MIDLRRSCYINIWRDVRDVCAIRFIFPDRIALRDIMRIFRTSIGDWFLHSLRILGVSNPVPTQDNTSRVVRPMLGLVQAQLHLRNSVNTDTDTDIPYQLVKKYFFINFQYITFILIKKYYYITNVL